MTKRKSEEDNAATTAKKRIPFTAPKNLATKAMYVGPHPTLTVFADTDFQNSQHCAKCIMLALVSNAA